jgi:hypothetical protein
MLLCGFEDVGMLLRVAEELDYDHNHQKEATRTSR